MSHEFSERSQLEGNPSRFSVSIGYCRIVSRIVASRERSKTCLAAALTHALSRDNGVRFT
jgi:hypothetical protein